MLKLDLHTHSQASPDGAITAENYRIMIQSGRLDCIAVTDHNRIDFAQTLRGELGDAIIVGEEIDTQQGEIIGLFLSEVIPPNLSAVATTRAIKAQGGLVYIPHPFEKVRHGISVEALNEIANDVDTVEVFNGRAFTRRHARAAQAWAAKNDKAMAASSDSHGTIGWGKTYSRIAQTPKAGTFVTLLKVDDRSERGVGFIARLYPKLNRLRKWLRRAA